MSTEPRMYWLENYGGGTYAVNCAPPKKTIVYVNEVIHVIEHSAYQALEQKLAVAIKGLEAGANRSQCRGYECCAGCGPIYECEEALALIKPERGMCD